MVFPTVIKADGTIADHQIPVVGNWYRAVVMVPNDEGVPAPTYNTVSRYLGDGEFYSGCNEVTQDMMAADFLQEQGN